MAEVQAAGQYLTFALDGEQFAVDIGMVREVLAFTSVTKVPRTPEYLRGVVNLRGSVVPVVDLRLKLGLSRTEAGLDTCIIIMEVETGAERLVLGALADAVQEVIELAADTIVPPPRMGTRVSTDFLRGIGRREEHFVMLIDLHRVLGGEGARSANEHEAAPLPVQTPEAA